MDSLTQFKEAQKQGWAHFAPLEAWTTPAAARLVRHARIATARNFERTAGPAIKVIEALSASDPARLSEFRREFEALAAEYVRDNVIRQDYLLTRATKL